MPSFDVAPLLLQRLKTILLAQSVLCCPCRCKGVARDAMYGAGFSGSLRTIYSRSTHSSQDPELQSIRLWQQRFYQARRCMRAVPRRAWMAQHHKRRNPAYLSTGHSPEMFRKGLGKRGIEPRENLTSLH